MRMECVTHAQIFDDKINYYQPFIVKQKIAFEIFRYDLICTIDICTYIFSSYTQHFWAVGISKFSYFFNFSLYT